ERRSAQTVLWQALHDLTIAASPALVFTTEEAWQEHAALLRVAESVHFAVLPKPGDGDSAEWLALLELRNAVNAAIEPLRAAKEVATTMEVDVTVTPRGAAAAQLLERYRSELEGFLMVARVTPEADDGAAPADAAGAPPYVVRAARTAYPKCERCWTYRADVGAS